MNGHEFDKELSEMTGAELVAKLNGYLSLIERFTNGANDVKNELEKRTRKNRR